MKIQLTLAMPDELAAGMLLEIGAGTPPDAELDAETVTWVVL